MRQFGYDERAAVTPEFVAEKMVDLVAKGEYGGGTCLEVSAAGVKVLGTWNIPKPEYYDKVPEEIRNNIFGSLQVHIDKDRQQSA